MVSVDILTPHLVLRKLSYYNIMGTYKNGVVEYSSSSENNDETPSFEIDINKHFVCETIKCVSVIVDTLYGAKRVMTYCPRCVKDIVFCDKPYDLVYRHQLRRKRNLLKSVCNKCNASVVKYNKLYDCTECMFFSGEMFGAQNAAVEFVCDTSCDDNLKPEHFVDTSAPLSAVYYKDEYIENDIDDDLDENHFLEMKAEEHMETQQLDHEQNEIDYYIKSEHAQ